MLWKLQSIGLVTPIVVDAAQAASRTPTPLIAFPTPGHHTHHQEDAAAAQGGKDRAAEEAMRPEEVIEAFACARVSVWLLHGGSVG